MLKICAPKLDSAAETILLAQIEAFKPDLILNQDAFHVDTALMRQIGGIGRPILLGQVGIAPSRGEDWTVYDLMLSQLSATVEFFRRAGVRAASKGEVVSARTQGDVRRYFFACA